MVLWLLFKIFKAEVILSQGFTLFGLTWHYYGMVMALAISGAIWQLHKSAEKSGIPKEFLDRYALSVILAGFFGARLYHVASSLRYYVAHPMEMFFIWQGGLSIFGALIGGALALLVVAKKLSKQTHQLWSVSFLKILDWVSLGTVLGQAIGRWGNLFNYEAYGRPTALPWGMFVPPDFRLPAYTSAEFFHPFFLYESLGTFCIFIFLSKKQPRYEGQILAYYLVSYGVLRFALEFLRADSTFLSSGLRLNVLTSPLLIVLGLSLAAWKDRSNWSKILP